MRRYKALDEWLDEQAEAGLFTNLIWWSVVEPAVSKSTKGNVKAPIGPSPNDADRTMPVAVFISRSGSNVKAPE